MDQATVEILIQIRDELAGLNRTREGFKGVRKEAESLGAVVKQGLGIGAGTEIARRGLNLLSQSFQASIGNAFRLAEEIKDQSEALNLTTEAYQVMRFELMQAGVDAARLTMAVSSQTQSLAEARVGVGAYADAYKALGLQAGQIEQMRPEERMIAVARAVENSTDKTRAFQAAGQILGQRGLPQLLNALRNLAANGYNAVAAAARNAGQIMGDETVTMLDEAKQRIENFQSTTLPIAAGTAIGWANRVMEDGGAMVANLMNIWQGRPLGDLTTPAGPKPPKPPTGPAFATTEQVLVARSGAAESKAGQIQNAALLTEAEKRKALLPILREQEEIYSKLIELRFGDTGKTLPKDGSVTEEDLARYQQRNELEAKLVAIRQQRMQAVDTPLAALGRNLADTTTYAQEALSGGISSAIDGLTGDLAAAANGTKSLGNAFENLRASAANVLQQIIARMLIIQTINAALGLFGFKLGGDAGGIVKMGETKTIKAAGGGSFLTSGPTTLTVGDNPGGIERVDVTPLSGIGTTTVNGRAARMGGGGSLIAAGRGREITIVQNLNVSAGVAGTVRAEMVAAMPMLRQLATDSVREALARGDL